MIIIFLLKVNQFFTNVNPALHVGDLFENMSSYIEQIHTFKSEGDALKKKREFANAENAYLQAMALKPSLLQVGLPAFKAIHLELAQVLDALGQLYLTQGQTNQAITAFNQALISNPNNAIVQLHFAQSMHLAQFTRADESLIKHMEQCLDNLGIDHQHLSIPAASVLKLDPAYSAWSAFLDQKNLLEDPAEKLKGQALDFLHLPLFLKLLQHTLICDAELEMKLTLQRSFFLHLAAESSFDTMITPYLPFLYSLARQCLMNEYIYSCRLTETEILTKETTRLASCRDFTCMPCIKQLLVLLSCYNYIKDFELIPQEAIRQIGRNDLQFQDWIHHHIELPKRLHDFQGSIPCISIPQNPISRKIRSQYEEHPYPQWHSLDVYPATSLEEYLRDLSPEALCEEQIEAASNPSILVAGCGTGKQALECATRIKNGNILALDLSLHSLAYGKMMADKMGISNVTFLQGDILDLPRTQLQFDLIECSGVLHHMEEPLKGWKILRSLLKPNGWMVLGLYSLIGRNDVTAAKQVIVEEGFDSSLENIRACRDKIRRLATSSPLLQQVSSSQDFYSTSTCRDLLFNVHEEYFTLPQIKSLLQELELSFKGFILQGHDIKKKYRDLYPGDVQMTSLDHWSEFERHNPMTFVGMYQFLVG